MCTTDITSPDGSICSHIGVVCDDTKPCTIDTCSPATGCVYTPLAEGSTCPTDTPCTTASCDDKGFCVEEEISGCCSAADQCDDGLNCTTDTCVGGSCSHAEMFCADTDGNPCTKDTCDEATGLCSSGNAKNCDDMNPCTDDTCVNDVLCDNAANSGPCSDGDSCTVGDVCSDKMCTSGTRNECDDSVACTSDECDPTTGGCSHTPNNGACDDGVFCNTDICDATLGCMGTGTRGCADSLSCTMDSCDENIDSCLHIPNCNDGQFCNGVETCAEGPGCVPVPGAVPCSPAQCNENTDICVAAVVCGDGIMVVPGEQCDDGNQIPNDGCSATCQRDARRAFMTFTTYDGNLVAAATSDSYCASRGGITDGLAAADCLCQSRAISHDFDKPVLACPGGGVACWKAWISDSLGSSPATRFTMASSGTTMPIYQVNSITINQVNITTGAADSGAPIANGGWAELGEMSLVIVL